ncbi:hypothetical protein BDV96DRAFT_608124 [Lophiotrema nucula]|uniref:Uncharacterized protein n=1 Tax=Lophiotrema nucula TaxID=690887 RepID=A0A6A5YE40_9PLEO|nr:hypothetical protein BDV96DRAFT_608124 [Lophiotrema nucula]
MLPMQQSGRAPPAPSMLPQPSFRAPLNPPETMTPAEATFRKLEAALGENASLLPALPLAELGWENQEDIRKALSYRINIGKVKLDDNTISRVAAYFVSNGADKTPDILLRYLDIQDEYGMPTPLNKHKLSGLNWVKGPVGSLPGWDNHRLNAVFKLYFLVKEEVSDEIQDECLINNDWTTHLIRACRAYQALENKAEALQPHSSDSDVEDMTPQERASSHQTAAISSPTSETLQEIKTKLGKDASLLQELPITELVVRRHSGEKDSGGLDHYIDLGSIHIPFISRGYPEVKEGRTKVGLFLHPAKDETKSPLVLCTCVEDMTVDVEKNDLRGYDWVDGPHGFLKTWTGDKFSAVAMYYFLIHPEASKELVVKFPINKTFLNKAKAQEAQKIAASQCGQMMSKKTGSHRSSSRPILSVPEENHEYQADDMGKCRTTEPVRQLGQAASTPLEAPISPPASNLQQTPPQPSQRTSGRIRAPRAVPDGIVPTPLSRVMPPPSLPRQPRGSRAATPATEAPAMVLPTPTPANALAQREVIFNHYLTTNTRKNDLGTSIQDNKLRRVNIERQMAALREEDEVVKRKVTADEEEEEELGNSLKRIRHTLSVDDAFELGEWLTQKKNEMRREGGA